MRRSALVLAAAVVVVAASALVLLGAARNRRGEPEAVIELSERELRLQAEGDTRTWAWLKLDWNADLHRRRFEAGWLDTAKLTSLGFSCARAAEDADAASYYGWQPPREAWVVLELDGETARRWREERQNDLDVQLSKLGGAEEMRRARETYDRDMLGRSRLFPIDAGSDPVALRRHYPDRSRYLIARGVLSATSTAPWDPQTRSLRAPFVRGIIEVIEVEAIQVPRDQRALLDDLARRDRAEARALSRIHRAEPSATATAPRYRVRLRYGSRYEPTIEAVLPGA